MSSVTLLHPAKATERNEMPFGKDTHVVPSNIVLNRDPGPQEKERFGGRTPQFAAVPPIAIFLWPLLLLLLLLLEKNGRICKVALPYNELKSANNKIGSYHKRSKIKQFQVVLQQLLPSGRQLVPQCDIMAEPTNSRPANSVRIILDSSFASLSAKLRPRLPQDAVTVETR